MKYDAFREMSGKLSYALALLDKNNNGFMVNSMYSREGCYSYVKEIIKGESYITLSEEEQEALKMAIESNGDIVSDNKLNFSTLSLEKSKTLYYYNRKYQQNTGG